MDRGQAERFAKALSHRGPDAIGVALLADESLALGNNRLAIVDGGPAGNQPLSYGDARWWITYNGEVYNYREIRERLIREGYAFRTRTDTEVVLAAYARWGARCLLEFNGMWSLAIWDARERSLFLARDRFGVKPLYTFDDGRRFAFASEVKAFLALPWVDGEFDLDYLARSLSTDHYLHSLPDTLLQAVTRLPAGHSLTLRPGAAPTLTRWWNTLDHLLSVPGSFDDQAAALRERFDDACRIRADTDVPMAVSLSGGMDSTSVLATSHPLGRAGGTYAAGPTPAHPEAYMAVFDDASRDERHVAEHLTRKLDVRVSYEQVPAIAGPDALDTMLYHAEDASSVHLGNWAVYSAMRRDGVSVALTGDGSDELLVAYYFQVQAALAEALMHTRSLNRVRDVWSIHRSLLPAGLSLGVLDSLLRSTASSLLHAHRPDRGHAIASPGLLRVAASPVVYRDFERDARRLPRAQLLRRRLYFDFHFGILPWILHIKDAISMAHGVEMRCPFLDWRVVCFALSLPSTSVIGGGFTKRLLRSAMAGRLPEEIRTRTSKVSFVDSESRLFWQAKEIVLQTVSNASFLQSPLWRGRELRREIEDAYQRRDGRRAAFYWKCIKTSRLVDAFATRRSVPGSA